MNGREQFVERTYPAQDGQEGNPYIQPNGLGRFFVARLVMDRGNIRTEFAIDEDGRLEADATHLVRTRYWGADDDGQWYPLTQEIAQRATFGRRRPRLEMSAETALVHIEANQREYAEAEREWNRDYTINDYPQLEGDTP